MTKALAELIDRAFDIKVFFNVGSYELNHYEDGSFADFRVRKVMDLPRLIELADGLEIKFFHEEHFIIVRLFERYSVTP
jgi:hypothetical protein